MISAAPGETKCGSWSDCGASDSREKNKQTNKQTSLTRGEKAEKLRKERTAKPESTDCHRKRENSKLGKSRL